MSVCVDVNLLISIRPGKSIRGLVTMRPYLAIKSLVFRRVVAARTSLAVYSTASLDIHYRLSVRAA